MKCLACSKDQSKKELVFTEDREAYCSNPFTCNDLHPNSVKNIVARGGAVQLYTEDELEDNLFEKLNVSDEMKDRIQKVATKPQSIRLSKVDIAYYLIMLQEVKGFSSISEAVRYCVTQTMEQEPIEEPKLKPAPNITKAEPAPVVVNQEPKEEIQYPVEDEEFTF